MATSLGGVNVPIDYSTRDYEDFRSDLLALAPTLTPEWTDFYPTDPGVVIAEMFSYIGDIQSYYIDRAANESFLPTATQRRSVINHGRLVGYELSPATSSIVIMQFTVNAAGTITEGDQVSTDPSLTGEDAVVFEVNADVVVGAAGTYDVECIQGVSVPDEILGDGNTLPSQEFQLERFPLSIDPSGVSSLKAYVDEGSGFVLYQQVPNFLSSEPTDRHYVVQIDENDRVTLTFGNGVNGRVVAGGTDNVKASYRVGGGTAGNSIGTGQIVKYLGSNVIVDSVTNGSNIPQGGTEKETIEEAKVNIPASTRALDRAVTHEDYETLARTGVGGVAQAKATQGRGPYEEVVYVAAAGSNPIASGTWDPFTESGTGLIGQVGDYLAPRKASPIKLIVRPPDPAPLQIGISQLEVNKNFFQSDVRVEVIDAIMAVIEGLRMGEDVVLSDVLCAAEALPGVKSIRLNVFKRKPTAVLVNPDPFFTSPVPDTVWTATTTDDTDHNEFVTSSLVQPTLQEVLEVTFYSATAYRVRGSVTGIQGTSGVIGSTWTNDLGNLQLLATAGGIPNFNSNQYRITVGSGAVVTHIIVGTYEIATLAEADISLPADVIVGGIK